jgi:hypothetical protein
MIAAGVLLAANLVVPVLWGDVYPFTSAPMFRDAPRECCNYKVYDPAEKELPTEDWLLQRVYDGNPVGYGVGVRPPAVLEQEFGVVHEESAVREHAASRFNALNNSAFEYVDVVQETIGPVDGQHVGVLRTLRWRVFLP